MIGISIHISLVQSVVHVTWLSLQAIDILRGKLKSGETSHMANQMRYQASEVFNQEWILELTRLPFTRLSSSSCCAWWGLLFSIALAISCVRGPPGSCISQLPKILAPSFLSWWVAGSLTLSCLRKVELG